MNYAKTYFTAALPEVWLFALGALFIVVTVFLPKGIIGLISKAKSKRSEAKPPDAGAIPKTESES